MAMAATAGGAHRPMTREDRKVILASAGEVFESLPITLFDELSLAAI